MNKITLYSIAFITGGISLAFELLTTKLIAPYYGGSFYVWAATIGTTMIGLAIGYFFSGKLIDRQKATLSFLRNLMFITGAYIVILPFYSKLILSMFLPLDVLLGIASATLLFNFPLFILLGLFTPILIHLALNNEKIGSISGTIYSISTLGGVFFLVGVGLYGLPFIGLRITVFVLGGILVILGGIVYKTVEK